MLFFKWSKILFFKEIHLEKHKWRERDNYVFKGEQASPYWKQLKVFFTKQICETIIDVLLEEHIDLQ